MSMLQLLIDMGIVHSFKCKYRQQIVREKLKSIEYSSTMPTIDIVKAIDKIKVAWDSVSQSTVKNCFKKAGFIKTYDVEDVDVEDEELDENYQDYMQACSDLNSREEFDYEYYNQIDNFLSAHEQYSDENVAASILEINNTEEVIEDEEKEEITHQQEITKSQALESLNNLKAYLMNAKYDSAKRIEQLFKIEVIINNQTRHKQTTLHSFFN